MHTTATHYTDSLLCSTLLRYDKQVLLLLLLRHRGLHGTEAKLTTSSGHNLTLTSDLHLTLTSDLLLYSTHLLLALNLTPDLLLNAYTLTLTSDDLLLDALPSNQLLLLLQAALNLATNLLLRPTSGYQLNTTQTVRSCLLNTSC